MLYREAQSNAIDLSAQPELRPRRWSNQRESLGC